MVEDRIDRIEDRKTSAQKIWPRGMKATRELAPARSHVKLSTTHFFDFLGVKWNSVFEPSLNFDKLMSHNFTNQPNYTKTTI